MVVINVVRGEGGGDREGERGGEREGRREREGERERQRERERNTYITCTKYTGVPQKGDEAVLCVCVVMKGWRGWCGGGGCGREGSTPEA